MEINDKFKKELMQKLLVSRMRILTRNPFYGQLLMNVGLGLDENCETAYADGEKICFNPDFLNELTDDELDFVLHHEILHIVLKHCYRFEPKNKKNPLLFNIACDMVVDSTIYESYGFDDSKIVIQGEYRQHKVPNGDEATKYTVEQVFDMLYIKGIKNIKDLKKANKSSSNGKNGGGGSNGDLDEEGGKFKDNHDKWSINDDALKNDSLDRIIVNSILNAKKMKENGGLSETNSWGTIPSFAERIFKDLTEPKLNWRTILNNFIQEEINDYSFSPPDKRYEGPFFLPDFNEMEENVKDILFMIDTSGSMSEKNITDMYSEIKGAIDQFGGKLKGWLGFFDAEVIPPVPFESVEEFKTIRAKGGGGTDFSCIFNYVFTKMKEKLPVAIIILTDGYAPMPKEKEAKGIPVLWVINNDDIKPNFGKVITIKE